MRLVALCDIPPVTLSNSARKVIESRWQCNLWKALKIITTCEANSPNNPWWIQSMHTGCCVLVVMYAQLLNYKATARHSSSLTRLFLATISHLLLKVVSSLLPEGGDTTLGLPTWSAYLVQRQITWCRGQVGTICGCCEEVGLWWMPSLKKLMWTT